MSETFDCAKCCESLYGCKYIQTDNGPYCVPCYDDTFANTCAECQKLIGHDCRTLTQGGVTYRDQPWHRECLVCTGCQAPLAGQQFTSRDEDPYCVACFGELFAPKCSSCKSPITGLGGGKYVSFEDRHWHHSCFCCARCSTSLVGQGFVPDGEQVLCQGCSQGGP